MNESIGHKLKVLRKTKKLTQQEVADKLGIKRATISNYEINRRTPSLSDLRRLAEYYGVGLDYFGVAQADDLLDLLARAKRVFENDDVPRDKKENLHRELMKLYLNIK